MGRSFLTAVELDFPDVRTKKIPIANMIMLSIVIIVFVRGRPMIVAGIFSCAFSFGRLVEARAARANKDIK